MKMTSSPLEVVARGDGQHNANGCKLRDGRERVEVVNPWDLREALRDEASLVADDVAGGVLLRAENPLGADDVGPHRSSRIACSHNGQSGRRRASARERGSSASASLISAASATSSSSAPIIQSPSPSASRFSSCPSSSGMLGGCTPRATTGSLGRAEVVPTPASSSCTRRDGRRTRVGRSGALGAGTGAAGRGATAAGSGCSGAAAAAGCSTTSQPVCSPSSCAAASHAHAVRGVRRQPNEPSLDDAPLAELRALPACGEATCLQARWSAGC